MTVAKADEKADARLWTLTVEFNDGAPAEVSTEVPTEDLSTIYTVLGEKEAKMRMFTSPDRLVMFPASRIKLVTAVQEGTDDGD